MKTAVFSCLALLFTVLGHAQGIQSGTLRGAVSGPELGPLPGATVTAESPALQGSRATVTGVDGTFVLAALPPGDYTVEIKLDGLAVVRQVVRVPLGGVAEMNAEMSVAKVSETVQVVGRAVPTLAGGAVSANIRYADVEALATPRTLSGIASLAPGVTQNGPNAAPTEGQSQIVINGGLAYDNVFMINGVDVNDNIFGWPQNLFIEDAIAETQVLSSGIPAEYGRFTGGVVNAITRSGSNRPAGSYRLNLSNDAWSSETPFEVTNKVSRRSKTNAVHEVTLGGPINRDRLWFFAAGRYQNLENSLTLPITASTYQTTDRNMRGELKLTGTVRPGQTVQASYLRNPREQRQQANLAGGLATIDPFALSDKNRPNHLFATHYRGALGPRLLAEGQYSQQKFSTDLGGGTSRDAVDSPIFSFDFTRQYNAPYFDRTDPDERNNRQLTGSALYLLPGHDVKVGYEWFRSNKVGGNSQSATGYVFYTDYVTDSSGRPVYDAGGRLMPRFVPGATQVFTYSATRGAMLNVDTQSAYLQDHWRISPYLTADLGVRLERVSSEASGATSGIRSTRAVPRLALAIDPGASGALVLHTTFSQVLGPIQRRLDERQQCRRKPEPDRRRVCRSCRRRPHFRGGVRCGELQLRRDLRVVPKRERLLCPRPVGAAHLRVHGVCRPAAGTYRHG